jgi:hypothetical protein
VRHCDAVPDAVFQLLGDIAAERDIEDTLRRTTLCEVDRTIAALAILCVKFVRRTDNAKAAVTVP